jgi:hypothetical protein
MFGYKQLKRQIEVTPTSVECPFDGCTRIVPRQRQSFRFDAHGI